MRKTHSSLQVEMKLARSLWGQFGDAKSKELRDLMVRYHISVSCGDVTYLDHRWYVTHSGLLRLAFRRRCSGIKTTLQNQLSDSQNNRWVFKAVVYKSPGSSGFFGYGDADARGRNPGRQPSLAQGLRNRPVLCRGAGLAYRFFQPCGG